MPELFTLTPPEEALDLFLSGITHGLRRETVAVKDALGRTAAVSISAEEPLPAFRKSTMDGYAVRASDTFGAGESLPAYLTVTGEAVMGSAESPEVRSGEAVLIHTGGMVPEGADAVVMIEHTQHAGRDEIEVLRPVGTGENILQIGEDVTPGSEIFPAGHRLRSQDLGGLTAVGITEIPVFVPPKAAIISTGDEVVPPEQTPAPGQVRDINSYTLSGLVREAGGAPVPVGTLPDSYDAIFTAASEALESADILVISAGSSVSVRDMTADVMTNLGSPGVLVHGVAVKPGKPTILGICDGKPVIGLPGNPVSALIVARLFLVPALRRLLGGAVGPNGPAERPFVRARLTKNINSSAGREEYVPVRLTSADQAPGSGQSYEAEPVFGKSNLIYTLVHADGLVRVPINANGISAGEETDVFIFQ